MIPVLSTEQIRAADAYTIAHEPISSIDLMERASRAFVDQFMQLVDRGHSIYIFCGTGNNGGDGLAIGRLLLGKGFRVTTLIVGNTEKGSEDFKKNLSRYPKKDSFQFIDEINQLPMLDSQDMVIDAIFGSGLSREPSGFYAEVIEHINGSEARTIAVDIASGLFADNPVHNGFIIKPWATITFQTPKLTFFQPQSNPYVGEWYVVDIGLYDGFVRSQSPTFYFTERSDIKSLIKPMAKFKHKGDAGRVLLVAGKRGSMGAALLAGKAAMRSGAGLLLMHVPRCGLEIIQVGLPEAMVEVDIHDNCISEITTTFPYDALAVGPGIGQSKETKKALRQLLQETDKPVILDADALNILADDPVMLNLIPSGSILTPHPGEFKRLVGTWQDDFDKLEKLRSFCQLHKVNMVLKGAYSAVCNEEGEVCFNPTGNPGMATAGSGDVLTGIILGLLGSGYAPFVSLKMGIYLHGLAGDLAAVELGMSSLMASDLIASLPKAYKSFEG